MRRRGGGLAALQRDTEATQSFAALSDTFTHSQVATFQSQLSVFRAALSGFATEHRDDIKRNPKFRQEFQQMCVSIGVDPLSGPLRGGGGWWSELLGLGDWEYELAVQVVSCCTITRERNGGLLEMEELLRMISRLRGLPISTSTNGVEVKDGITEHDITRSIKTLKPLGAGYEVVQVGKKKMIRSVVKELDNDQSVVLALASELGGWVDEESLVQASRWTVERSRTALDNMTLRDGLAWIDDQDESRGIIYWVPSVVHWPEE